jgi:hypothetical protein
LFQAVSPETFGYTFVNFLTLNKCLKRRDRSEELDVRGKIILDWILGKYGGKVWTGSG